MHINISRGGDLTGGSCPAAVGGARVGLWVLWVTGLGKAMAKERVGSRRDEEMRRGDRRLL